MPRCVGTPGQPACLIAPAQRVGLLSPELRDGDSQLLPLRVAAEVINAEVSAGITLEKVPSGPCIYREKLKLYAPESFSLGLIRLENWIVTESPGLDGSQLFLRQLRALRVDKLVAHTRRAVTT